MPTIQYGLFTCTNCGQEREGWGVEVVKDEFLCESCLKLISIKIEDMKTEAKI